MIVTKQFRFDYAHRLMNHAGKCRNLHGHGGIAEITVVGPARRPEMVVDFGVMKSTIGGWIDRYWDHATILNERDDPLLEYLIGAGFKFYRMVGEPTAENMARQLAEAATQKLREAMGLNAPVPVRVRIYETPTSWAEWAAEEPR